MKDEFAPLRYPFDEAPLGPGELPLDGLAVAAARGCDRPALDRAFSSSGFPLGFLESKAPAGWILDFASSPRTNSIMPPIRPPGAGSPSANSMLAPSSPTASHHVGTPRSRPTRPPIPPARLQDPSQDLAADYRHRHRLEAQQICAGQPSKIAHAAGSCRDRLPAARSRWSRKATTARRS